MEKDYKKYTIYLGLVIALLIGIIIFLINELTGFGGYRIMYVAFAVIIIPAIVFIELGVKFLIKHFKDNKK
jgi:predicted Co/Zn/Cd cation transporter (cation efflux family)